MSMGKLRSKAKCEIMHRAGITTTPSHIQRIVRHTTDSDSGKIEGGLRIYGTD